MKQSKPRVKRQQPKKDSRSKRINLDNVRDSKFEKDLEKTFTRRDSNDIRWYLKSPARLEAAGRLPFSSVTGVTRVGIPQGTTKEVCVPGVMQLAYSPNFVPQQVVIEQAYQNMYSEIVHANSRNYSYDYTDLAIMHMAGTEVFAAIALGIRAYGIMRAYSGENAYYPNTLLYAAGFDPKDLRKNYSHMWSDLLNLIAQSRQIWLPNTMPIIERRIWMNLNAYTDSQSIKGQVYLYKPVDFYQYSAKTESTGGKLVAKNIFSVAASVISWDTYITAVQDMIDAIIPDQDRGIMFGDILKCYGKEGIFAMNEIAIDYTTTVTYNPEVLWQVENSTHCASKVVEFYQNNLKLGQRFAAFPAINAYTDKTAALTAVTVKNAVPSKALLNFHQKEQPTPEQLMVATRMTCLGTSATTHYNYGGGAWTADATKLCSVPTVSGTEYITNVNVMYVGASSTPDAPSIATIDYKLSSTSAEPTWDTVFVWGAFDWAPSLTVFSSSSTMETAEDILRVMEYDNYQKVSRQDIEQLHRVAIYSLFNMPTLS